MHIGGGAGDDLKIKISYGMQHISASEKSVAGAGI